MSGKVSSGHWLICQVPYAAFFFSPPITGILIFKKSCKTNFGSDAAASLWSTVMSRPELAELCINVEVV